MVAEIAALVIFVIMFLLIVLDRIPRQWVTLGCGALMLVLVFGVCMHDSGAIWDTDLPARDFDRNPDAYLGCEWLPPKFDYVDPMKDVQAEIMAIGAGLKSRSQAISERGYDAEQVDAEIAADRERANGLGLSFGQTAAQQQKEAADG